MISGRDDSVFDLKAALFRPELVLLRLNISHRFRAFSFDSLLFWASPKLRPRALPTLLISGLEIRGSVKPLLMEIPPDDFMPLFLIL